MSDSTTTPKDHMQMLVYLKQKTKENPDIAETIYLVKDSNSWEANYKSLNNQSKDKLAKTYAFLMSYDSVEDEEVPRLNRDGLRTMVLHRLTQLMPEQCQICIKTYFYETTDKPMVCCQRCGRGACSECYPATLGAGKSFFYLCKDCEVNVSSEIGLKGLEPNKHLLKKTKTTKKKVAELDKAPEEVTEKGADESCVFLQDVEEVTVEETVEKEAIQEEPEGEEGEEIAGGRTFAKQPKRGYKKKEEVKDKVCPHLKKGHCHYSLSGRKPYNGVSQCPFLHPVTCPKLLNNGSKGKYGCDGTKCGKFHPKMCPVSLKFIRCVPGCKQGFHVRSNSRAMQEKRREEETKRRSRRRWWRRRGGETGHSSCSSLGSGGTPSSCPGCQTSVSNRPLCPGHRLRRRSRHLF